MLPLGDDLENSRHRPYVTFSTAGLLLVVFGYTSTLGPDQRQALVDSYGLIPARLFDEPASAWPSLFSYLLLHGGLLHALGNVLFLWVFGRALERELRWFFLPMLLGLGAVAGLGTALLRPESTVPTIGASGAISGLIGAYLVLFPEAGVRLLVAVWAVPALILRTGSPILEVPAWVFIALWFGFQVFGSLGAQFSPSGIDYGAHLAGFLAGYGLIRLLRGGLGLWPDHDAPRIGWDPLRQPVQARKGAYLAANRPLAVNHVVRAGDLTVVEPPSGLAHPESIPPRQQARAVGRRLRVERYRYEALLWSDLAEPGGGEPGGAEPTSLDGHAHGP